MIPLLLASFFVLLLLRFPIAVALGLSCMLGLAFQPMTPTVVVAQRMFVSLDSFPLMVVPLYMLAGYLMSAGGISRRIVAFSSALVGDLPGGLAHVNILASMIFGGISGSAVADTAGIGNIMIPEMKSQGYPRSYAAAVTAVSSTLGIVIPPSIPMVIVGAMLGVSVGKLFLGGVVPGLLIGLALMAVAYAISSTAGALSDPMAGPATPQLVQIRDPGMGEPAPGLTNSSPTLAGSFRHAFWALLMPPIVIVGIVAGIFTPTEAGAVAVVYALAVATFIYRELSAADLYEALTNTALSTAKVFFLIATAGLYSWLLTASGFPTIVGDFLSSLTESPALMLLIMVCILLAVTTFMESIAAMVLLLPILFPVAEQVGIDPVHFGVVVVVSIGVGLVTPPVGLCLFVAADVAEVDMSKASTAAVPFLGAMIALLGVLVFIPELITAIPTWIMQ